MHTPVAGVVPHFASVNNTHTAYYIPACLAVLFTYYINRENHIGDDDCLVRARTPLLFSTQETHWLLFTYSYYSSSCNSMHKLAKSVLETRSGWSHIGSFQAGLGFGTA